MAKKKTTLMIEEGIYDAVRMEAAKQRKSISYIVAEAAKAYLAGPTEPPGKVKLPFYRGAKINLPSNVDIRSSSQVLAYLDAQDEAAGLPPSQF